MVLSYYLLKLPYSLIHGILSLFNLNNYYAAYIGDELDYFILEPVLKYLPELKLISKNKKIQSSLAEKGIKSGLLPAFPKGVLMCRLAAHKFPASQLLKIGMRHGPYHFKTLSDKKNYLLFDHFLFTSEHESETARNRGITNGRGIGYPKIDKAFNGEITIKDLHDIKKVLGLDENKKTLLFTATWENSGMSAIEKWYDKLSDINNDYNILVSLHPWVSDKYRNIIENSGNIHLISSYNTIPYIMLADICIGDTSSILAECCALDKPVITFAAGFADRLEQEVIDLLDRFTLRINNFEELLPAIEQYERKNDLKREEREQANRIFFSNLDGSSSEKAAAFIRKTFGLKKSKE